MQITVEKLQKSEVKIIIEVSKEEMAKYKEKAVEQISKDVKIKGFRPGHAPLHVLEEKVGKEVIKAQTLEIVLPLTYAEAVQKEKVEVISRPKINIISEDPFKYEATVAVLPEVKVKDYDKIKVKKLDDKPDSKEVDEAIEYMKKSFTEFKDVQRPLKKGDKADIDFEGFDEKGVSLENTKSKNHPVILGEKTLIREFEDQLVGLKKNDEKELTVKFPKPYHAPSLEGKKIKFKVKVHKTQEVHIPELDEVLIERITGKKMSVKEFKKDVSQNIGFRKKEENKMKYENQFLEKVLENTKVEVPDALVEEEATYMLEDFKRDLAQKGADLGQFMEQTKMDEDRIKEKYKKEAGKRVKIRLALNYIFRTEKFDVTDKEVKAEIEKTLRHYPVVERKRIQEMYKTDRNLMVQIKNRILLQKLFDKFLKVE
ncbi:MAG: trigger factor [Patescibacteria group bacterium]